MILKADFMTPSEQIFNPWHLLRETVPNVAAVHDICRFLGVPKVQPAEGMQTRSHEIDDFIGYEGDFPI